MALSQKKPMPMDMARALSTQIRNLLEPSCQRIEVAGSIRRGNKPDGMYGDIELLAIPLMQEVPTTQVGLFAQKTTTTSRLWSTLDAWINDQKIQHLVNRRWGDKYRAFIWNGVQVDLFTAEPDSWGYQLLLRTGPSWFSQRFVSRLEEHGYIGHEGRIWTRQTDGSPGTPMAVKEEHDAFSLIDRHYIPPQNRTDR